MSLFSRREGALVLVGSFIYAIGMACFVGPAHIAPGGATGVALMLNYLFGLPIGAMTFVINVPLLILGWKGLSHQFAVKTTLTIFLSSAILDYIVTPYVPSYAGNRLFGSLYGGIIAGVGMAFIFMAGCTTGGADILGYLVQKKHPDFSIGRALLILNGIILLASIAVYGDVDAGLFGLVCLYATTKVIDTILYGLQSGSQISVITQHSEALTQAIISKMHHTATIVSARGAYSDTSQNIVICAVRRSEFNALRKIIQETDPTAFVIVTEATEILGLGFEKITK
jgi:uncharacterized membrane-anchored protein YitT (DUF2179 family)